MNKLPTEILQTIAHYAAPIANGQILEPNDDRRRTLLALLHVNRHWYHVAAPLIYRHCVFLNGKNLKKFAESLRYSQKIRNTTSTTLLTSLASTEEALERHVLKPSQGLTTINALYVHYDLDGLKDYEMGRALIFIIDTLAPTLTRLIYDIPLRNLRTLQDRHNFRRSFRSSLFGLKNLRELVAIQDDLCLTTLSEKIGLQPVRIDPWGAYWPHLERLSLFGRAFPTNNEEVDMSDLASLPNLKTLFLSMTFIPRGIDIRGKWTQEIQRHRYTTAESCKLLRRRDPSKSLDIIFGSTAPPADHTWLTKSDVEAYEAGDVVRIWGRVCKDMWRIGANLNSTQLLLHDLREWALSGEMWETLGQLSMPDIWNSLRPGDRYNPNRMIPIKKLCILDEEDTLWLDHWGQMRMSAFRVNMSAHRVAHGGRARSLEAFRSGFEMALEQYPERVGRLVR